MPELPEVETTCRGIAPHVTKQVIHKIIIRDSRLRWPVSPTLADELSSHTIEHVVRRGKYILLHTTHGTLIIHLGMSGSLRILPSTAAIKKHDHIDIIFNPDLCLRFNDPRRFGCLLWTTADPAQHFLLKNLGIEPLNKNFTGDYLYQQSRNKSAPIKSFIMDSQVVVGVGNIYANEALFAAGIHPKRAAKRINREKYLKLAKNIKKILTAAIKRGGTTLRNFTASDGNPGYFKQKLQVYGRGGLPCFACQNKLREIRLAQRATVYCPYCQL